MLENNTNTNPVKGYAAAKAGGKLESFTYVCPEIRPWDIELEISHCGLCHSDLHLINNDWTITNYPLVPGHEIIGLVKKKGALVKDLEIGQRVGVGWQRSSCNSCEWCHQGEENLCLKQEPTCVGHHGGFADKIITDSRLAFAIPQELASENAAPLLCGGATVFSPFVEHKIDATMHIGVIGIGGLGHLAIQFAHAFGCKVTAFSSSSQKQQEAKELGADHFISSTDEKSLRDAANTIDFLFSTSSAHMNWDAFLGVLRPKGKLCLMGAPKEEVVSAQIFNLITGRKTICGSNIASGPVIRKMLKFAARHNIVAKTEVFPMSEINTAIDKLSKNQIRYRAVLKNNS